jgi:hypothetical protein
MNAMSEVLKIWLPVLTAVGGGLWALWLYIDHRRETRNAGEKERARTAETRLLESRKPFLELQLRLYFDAARVAGVLITETFNSPDWEEAVKRFWSLYWAELSVVESKAVETAMFRLGEAIKIYTKEGGKDKSDLQSAAYDLAHNIRWAIADAWGWAEPDERDKAQLDRPFAMVSEV